MTFHDAGARKGSLNFELHTILNVHQPETAPMQLGVFHGAEIDEQPEHVTCVEFCDVHVAGCAKRYITEMPVNLIPQVTPFNPLAVHSVWHAIHVHLHTGDVGVYTFFRVSCAACVGLAEEKEDAFHGPARNVDALVDDRV